MKNLLYTFILLSVLSCCKEERPNITFNHNLREDSTYVLSTIPLAQTKAILFEDFTGVRCANCPDMHEKAQKLLDANPGKVTIIAMHPLGNFLTKPFTTFPNYQDFNIQEGAELMADWGINKNLPSVGIDRIVNPVKNFIYTNSYYDWNNTITAQLKKKTPINIDIENKILLGDSVLITCYMTATEQVNDSVYLTLALLEDGMVNPQDHNGDIDTFYVHNNVVRKFITPYIGTYLKTTFEPGRVYRKLWAIPIDPKWKLDNCRVVAYVHKRSSSSNEVWHSVSQKIK